MTNTPTHGHGVLTGTVYTDWCFTDNTLVDFLPHSAWDEGLFSYMVVGFEEGASGNFHHQGFVQFKEGYCLAELKDLWPRTHWERRKGTATQASEYCKKDGAYEEKGTLNLGR